VLVIGILAIEAIEKLYPNDTVRNTRVNSCSTKENASVLDVRVFAGKQHDEAGYTEEGTEDVAETALLGAIGNVADCNRHDGG